MLPPPAPRVVCCSDPAPRLDPALALPLSCLGVSHRFRPWACSSVGSSVPIESGRSTVRLSPGPPFNSIQHTSHPRISTSFNSPWNRTSKQRVEGSNPSGRPPADHVEFYAPFAHIPRLRDAQSVGHPKTPLARIDGNREDAHAAKDGPPTQEKFSTVSMKKVIVRLRHVR